jgi:hypothetical protein
MSNYIFGLLIVLPFLDFQNVARLQSMGLLINTSNCQIPNFDPRDQDVLPFIKTAKLEENCHQTHYNWSFIRDHVS